ncbi:MAG: hypothetical protein IPJ88_04015 [Myxococcales bacterium]|nr:MAG: hypothetical protein IPJ88_04015 [Myxococcales bacterium]
MPNSLTAHPSLIGTISEGKKVDVQAFAAHTNPSDPQCDTLEDLEIPCTNQGWYLVNGSIVTELAMSTGYRSHIHEVFLMRGEDLPSVSLSNSVVRELMQAPISAVAPFETRNFSLNRDGQWYELDTLEASDESFALFGSSKTGFFLRDSNAIFVELPADLPAEWCLAVGDLWTQLKKRWWMFESSSSEEFDVLEEQLRCDYGPEQSVAGFRVPDQAYRLLEQVQYFSPDMPMADYLPALEEMLTQRGIELNWVSRAALERSAQELTTILGGSFIPINAPYPELSAPSPWIIVFGVLLLAVIALTTSSYCTYRQRQYTVPPHTACECICYQVIKHTGSNTSINSCTPGASCNPETC